MSCLLVIASLCFANVQRVEVSEPSSISRWATARVADATVQLLLSSDNLVGEYDPRLMNRACSEAGCVSYHKWCGSKGEQFTCYYSTLGNPISQWLRISAPNQRAYDSAASSLGLIVGTSSNVVPLVQLNVTSDQRLPPFCRRGGLGPQCPE